MVTTSTNHRKEVRIIWGKGPRQRSGRHYFHSQRHTGSGGSIIAANKLISYRLGRLEETVRERSGIVELVYVLEGHNAVAQEQLKELPYRVELIERERKETRA